MSEPLIELIDVHKRYRRDDTEVPVLHGVSLSVGQGEKVAIMGRSGSGKSTLLNLLGCLDTPSSGRYLFEGRDVSGLKDQDLSKLRNATFGFVFQAFHLLKGLNVVENVELPLEYSAVEEAQWRPRALELLELVGLDKRALHRPAELSGGERQRVAIARALVNRPKLLLADEPTGALDTRSQEAIVGLFSRVRETMGTTLVTVTHDPEVARALGDRVVRVSDGRVEESP